jgi:malate synthase
MAAASQTQTVKGAEGVEVRGKMEPGFEKILTPEALAFIARLQRELGPTREGLLARRAERQREIDAGATPDFLAETTSIREDASWQVASVPKDLQNRQVEITGPVSAR